MNPQTPKNGKNPFKNKKFELAPTRGVNLFQEISSEFMKKIFDFEEGEYLITDESSLWDFTRLGGEIGDIHKKIQQIYDFDVSNIESGNLLKIFMRIQGLRYGGPS